MDPQGVPKTKQNPHLTDISKLQIVPMKDKRTVKGVDNLVSLGRLIFSVESLSLSHIPIARELYKIKSNLFALLQDTAMHELGSCVDPYTIHVFPVLQCKIIWCLEHPSNSKVTELV